MDDSPIIWDTIEINGKKGTEISIERVKNGVLVKGDDLSNLEAYGINKFETVKLSVATDKKAVLLTEDETQKFIAKIDKDEDGTYETILGSAEPSEVQIDKGNLRSLLDKADSLKEKDYTKKSWKTFIEIKSIAKTVLDNENATKEDVDNAIEELKKAMNGLEKISKNYKHKTIMEKSNNKEDVSSIEAASTGDDSDVMQWLLLAVISFGIGCVIIYYKKKK